MPEINDNLNDNLNDNSNDNPVETDNNYNNQIPPVSGNRPDYSYNWNGAERKKKNNGKKGAIFALITVIVCLLIAVMIGAAMLLVGTFFGLENSGDDFSQPIFSDFNDEDSTSDVSSQYTDSDYEGSVPSGDSGEDLSTNLTDIYEKCSPACCTVKVYVRNQLYSIGSGFVYDSENGYIATNHHVIESGDKYELEFYNGDVYEAYLVGSNDVTDLAVLHVDASNLPSISLGDSNSKKVGENVIAIGTPYNESLAGTMTCGIISGIARDVEITDEYGRVIKTMTLLQTDCSINPGNSGGPLIDMAGNVIGITSLKLVDEQFEGIGFAIPITEASVILNKLIRGEEIDDTDFASPTPKIGITVTSVENGLSSIRRTPTCSYPEGVFITDIEATSSAYEAGLSRYDIITEMEGTRIKTTDELSAVLSKLKAGRTVSVKVFRFNSNFSAGAYYTIEFKLDSVS